MPSFGFALTPFNRSHPSYRSSSMSDGCTPFKRLKFSFPRRDTLSRRSRVTTSAMNEKFESSPMYRVPGYMVWDHTFRVPLDWSARGETTNEIRLFAREVVAPGKSHTQLPYLLYLQGSSVPHASLAELWVLGGPGFAATLPTEGGSWLKTATNYYRVVLLDQRGTGRSSPVTCWNLQKVGTPQEQAAYLTHFRSDSIVQDAEFVRRRLVPPANQNGRWSILGQSYGGFCCIHYLSAAPEALSEVLVTGGIPPLIQSPNSADAVYQRTYERVITQNEKFYHRYPGDVKIVQRIVRHVMEQPEGYLLGCSGLGFAGGFDRLHYLLEDAFDEDRLSYRFLKNYESWMNWETNPLYVLLHESIYTQGPATRWAAHRVRLESFEEAFDAAKALAENRPVYFTGEMVFPWMFEDFKELIPLRETADIVAQIGTWPALYNLATLAENTVYTASATYYEDMYVDFELAQESVQHISGVRQWITNEYMHSGLRDDGNKILEKLIGLTRDSILLQ